MVGFATGFAQAVQDNAVDGDQTNVPLPVPLKVVFVPAQIVTSGPALAEGSAGYVTEIKSVAVPQLLVTSSVYVKEAAGVHTGFGQVVQLNPVDGDHENVPLPVPVPLKVVLSPAHTETSNPALAVGKAFIPTLTASSMLPQEFVTVSVYVVAIVGFATGFEIVVLLNPVDGDHAKVPLPVPFKVVLEPGQMETSGPAFTVKAGSTVTVASANEAVQGALPIVQRST